MLCYANSFPDISSHSRAERKQMVINPSIIIALV